MTKLLALLWIIAIAGLAGVLFQVKYEVQGLEQELAGVQHGIVKDKEAIHVLEAEWSYLNQPERIAELSRRYLELQPVTAQQIASIVALPPAPEDMGAVNISVTVDDAGAPAPLPRLRPETPDDWRPRAPREPVETRLATREPTVRNAAPAPTVAAPAPATTAPVVARSEPAPTKPQPPQVAKALGDGIAINPVTGRPLPTVAPTLVSGGGER